MGVQLSHHSGHDFRCKIMETTSGVNNSNDRTPRKTHYKQAPKFKQFVKLN